MGQRINFKVGDIVNYMGKQYEAVEVYSYMAYLRGFGKSKEKICVGIGDLVVGGAYLENGSKAIR